MNLVLIVDDEPEVRRAVARELGAEFEVRLAASYLEALQCLAGPDGARIRAVVTDCDMGPGLPTGLDLLAHVRRAAPSLVRVLVSGSACGGCVEIHACSGLAHACFGKPWARGEIRDVLRRALRAPVRRPVRDSPSAATYEIA